MASEPSRPGHIGLITGLRAEAKLAQPLGWDSLAGGGTPEGATRAAAILIRRGATALISFGLAGGLDPALKPGTILVPRAVNFNNTINFCDSALAQKLGGMTDHLLLGGTTILATAAEKSHAWHITHAHAIDLESAAIAEAAQAHNIPFAILRAICDPAHRNLAPAALHALNSGGEINLLRVLGALLRAPGQLPALISLARDAALARRALTHRVRQIQT